MPDDGRWTFNTNLDGSVELHIYSSDEDTVHDALAAAADLYPTWDIADWGPHDEGGEFYILEEPPA